MAVTLLDSWVLTSNGSGSPGSRTISSGTNRLLVYVAGEESTSHEPTAVTYGGESMTQVVLQQSTGGFPASGSIWILDEAGIAAAVGTAFAVTFDGATHDGQYRAFTAVYEGVNQTTPTTDNDSSTANGSQTADLSLTAADDVFGIIMWVEGTSGANIGAEWTGATEQIEEDATSVYLSLAHAATTSGGFAPTLSGGSGFGTNCLVAVTLNPAAVAVQVGLAQETDTALIVLTGNQAALLDPWEVVAATSEDALAGVTFGVSSGSNRMLVVAIAEDSSTGKPTGVTYGGVAMTATTRATSGVSFPVTAQFFVLNEAGIASAGSSTIAVQGIEAHNGGMRVLAASYVNAGQGGLIDTDTASAGGEVVDPITLTTSDRGTAFALLANSAEGVDVAWTAATEQIEEEGSGIYLSIAEQSSTGADVTFTPTSGTINNNAMTAIVIGGVTLEVAVGLATETDSALDIASQKAVSVGQAAETDSALTIVPDAGERVAVGQASETDSALSITPVAPGKVAVDQVTETDTALAIVPAVVVPVGLASETDTAQAVTFRREVIVDPATEIDSALALVNAFDLNALALERGKSAGSASSDAAEMAEAKRLGALRRQIEADDEEIATLLPAIAKSLLMMRRRF